MLDSDHSPARIPESGELKIMDFGISRTIKVSKQDPAQRWQEVYDLNEVLNAVSTGAEAA